MKPAVTTYKDNEYKCEREPTQREIDDMLFGWAVEHGVTSNSVIYIKDGCTVGIGTGEQDRVGVAEIAVHKAYIKYADILCFDTHGIPYADMVLEIEQGKRDKADQESIDAQTKKDRAGLPGSVMISDAFFPYRDGADVGIRQGVSAILQAGGSMRDFETIETALLAAETGHLVFSTLHTVDATETVNRIISVFPPHQQKQIRIQLAQVLRAVISLRLIARCDGNGRVPAAEIMVVTPYIRECIENKEKTKYIREQIALGTSQYGMQTFDQSLYYLYKSDLITLEEALRRASNPDELRLKMEGVQFTADAAREEMESSLVSEGTTADESPLEMNSR